MASRRSTLKSQARRAGRRLHHESLEKRELLAAEIVGPQLIGVAANSGENFNLQGNNQLLVSPKQLTFRFDGGQEIDPTTLSAFRFTRSGGDGSFTDGNEVNVNPGFIGLGDSTRIVIARFSSDLPDDQYRISIAGFDQTDEGLVALRNIDGDRFQVSGAANTARPVQEIFFNVEVGPRVVAVVPQPVTGTGTSRIQHRDQVQVFFNNDPLGNPNSTTIVSTGSATDPTVVQPRFYNLFLTSDTVETGDDSSFQPTSIVYEPALQRATLTFASDLSTLAGTRGEGTFRLRIGSSQALPVTLPSIAEGATDSGDTFGGARNLGVNFGAAGDASVIVSGEIEATAGNTIQWPGLNAPGIRDDRRDAQVIGRADTTDGINVYFYNFADRYGFVNGNVLENSITPAQKQRTREVLDLYAQHLGVQFVETEDRGLQIVTGDLRAIVEGATTGAGGPLSEYRVNDLDPTRGVLILESAENWYDGYGLSPNPASPSWFVEALRGVGSLLGIGDTFEQVPGVASGSNPALYTAAMFPNSSGAIPPNFSIEPDFLSTSDIVPGQALHRPEVRDADLYRFNVSEAGKISVESFAQRLLETSMLDTDLKLWKLNPTSNKFELVARNADFYGDDSFIGVEVDRNADGTPASYVLGVTATGNDDYNPDIAGSGGGGRSQGRYEVRISFESDRVSTITDTNGSRLDGDSDGTQGGDFNFWFRVAKPKAAAGVGEARTLFVNPSGIDNVANGSLAAPYRSIAFAFSQAREGDIVRLLPDAGSDGLVGTTADNIAYEIGRSTSNQVLKDGESFEVPKGVTVMIDAGAILKLQNAKISVGSESIDSDRSLAALQVLGSPFIVDQGGNVIDGKVQITSYKEERRNGVLLGQDTNQLPTTPDRGDWAGIEFRNDVDYSEGRPVWETEGIFIDYVSHADIRYGGGSISLTDPIVTPLQMLESRPTLIYNQISVSRDAAMSADPNSFLETNFHSPVYQQASIDRLGATFTSDYDRVGPLIRGNTLTNNSINGLFVRVETPALDVRKPLTVSGRFDDADITHVLSEVLVLQGNPGGPLMLEERPDVLGTVVTTPSGTGAGTLAINRVVDYRITYVTSDGFESLASLPTRSVTVGTSGAVDLAQLPAAPAEFAGRRLYRLTNAGTYEFVTSLDRATSTYSDTGFTRGGLLAASSLAATSNEKLLPRVDARLSVDPGIVLKMDTARIEATFGADFYAEGTDGSPVVFTSRKDDRYGAGGTFDTNNDGITTTASPNGPAPGDWSGLVFRQGSSASIDNAVIAFGGGESAIAGGFSYFNAVEVLQSDVRIANSILASNESGTLDGSVSYSNRDGVGFNGPATIFVRGAQPVIVDNIIVDNTGAAISINPDSLNYTSVVDQGRGTGLVNRFVGDTDNQGPLVEANRLDRNGINGMLVRNESLTTESVWDDTDIVHVVEGHVYTFNHHHRSGLRLKSDPNQSLVVKVEGGGSLNADRYRTDVEDSIGGTIQVLGQPGFPVVLTSINDCLVGAGFTPDGLPQQDTIESGLCGVIDVETNAPFVDVIVVMDESASMGSTQAFSAQFIQDVEAGLLAAGVGTTGGNRYGGVGFGMTGPGNEGRSILVGGNLFGTAAEYAAATSQYSTAGAVEDGYAGIDFALRNYAFRPEAAKFIVLATDEPRSNVNNSLTLASTLASLQAAGITLIGILGASIEDDAGTRALAIDNTDVFVETPTGFTSSPGGTITFGLSVADYVPLVTGTNGVTGDLRSIGLSQVSANKFSQVLTQSLVGRVTGGNPAASGDWQGIVINPGANDRNVAFVLESERAIATASAANAIPANAQIIGSLAQNEKSADENRRLGFNVRGSLSQNGDIDVYRFTANGGTEVFLDIDDTDFGLDTVVELLDINGKILALSNNSDAESNTPGLLFRDGTLPAGNVLPLYKSGVKSVENPNPLDAGMRVILPGNSSTVNQYFVRVRSSNLRPGDPASRLVNTSLVGAGLSSGQYQLSVRLRETDEIAGTTIRLADIRYASTAIDLPAAPNNSPLAGEHAEELSESGLDLNNVPQNVTLADVFNGTANLSFTNAVADPLGPLSASDRGVLRVSGELGNQVGASAITPDYLRELDVDVYEVLIQANTQGTDIIDENRFVSTIFDIDYANQFGGPNTSISVYTSTGQLILHSRDSNITDDQGRPTLGTDATNLPGGSGGTLDAYIGPVELQEGTYYVVVSSAQMIPSTLNQLFAAAPLNSNVRILPIDSSRRVAEYGFNEFDTNVGQPVVVNGTSAAATSVLSESNTLNTAADFPTVQPLFDGTSIVPYKLEDVRLFVTLDQGLSGNNNTTVISVDPFTGQLERTIGQFGQPTGDLAIRRDGELFAYSLGPAGGGRNAGNTGNYLNVSSANGGASQAGDDGLTYRRNNDTGAATENDDNGLLLINAMAFVPTTTSSFGNNPGIPDTERMFAVGNRTNNGRGELPEELRRNVIYSMVANGGAATNQGSTNGQLDRNFGNTGYVEGFGPGSNKQELGIVDTGQFVDSPIPPDGPYLDPFTAGGDVTGIGIDPLSSNRILAVTDGGYVYSFSSTGGTRTVDVEPGLFGLPGSYGRVINTTNFGLVAPHPDDFASVNRGFVEFQSMSFGPSVTEQGRFRNVIFGVSTEGWIYTFTVNTATQRVVPAPVLVDGRSAIQMTVNSFGSPTPVTSLAGSPVGFAFSTRQENIWHVTSDFSTPFGNPAPNAHGVFPTHNQTRTRISGGSSLYFGNEIDGDPNNNTLDGGNGTLNPGGVHGSTVSAPFSLEGYNSGDKPTLYFTYLLETEDGSDFLPNRQQTDSFRVFAVGDDGQWQLVSTNDTWRSWSNAPVLRSGGDGLTRGDEYDYFATNGGIPIQELFDNAGGANSTNWRQARIDLSPLAGNKNVQLRFDFSTAGGMQSQVRTTGYLSEIQATAGTDAVEGTTFSVVDSSDFFGETTTFEYVRGAAVTIPRADAILDGQQLTFVDATGASTTVTLTTDPLSLATNPVLFTRLDTPATIATAIVNVLTAVNPQLAASANGSEVRVAEASSFSLTPARFGAAAMSVPTPSLALAGQSLQFTNQVGKTTSVTLETAQRVAFGNGTETITVTATTPGAANGVRVQFVDRFNGITPALDIPASATFNPLTRVITVTYNSDPNPLTATPTNNDFNAIAAAINGLANFDAVLSTGVGTTPFTPPVPANSVVFANDEVYFNPTGTAASLATVIATRLNALDPTLQATAIGDQLILRGASVVPIVIPANVASLNGASISYTTDDGNLRTFTLTTSTTPSFLEVTFDPINDTPAIVAGRLAAALGIDFDVSATAVDNQLVITGARTLTLSPEFTADTINIESFNAGTTASQFLANGNVPIFFNDRMTSVGVRDAIRDALARGLGEAPAISGVSTATIANYPAYGTNRIRIFEKTIETNTTSLGVSSFLPGDEFGAFGSTSISANSINTRPGTNNDIQGVYIDDIVIGFAERGEVVINAPSNRTFEVLPEYRTETFADDQQPEFLDEILVGNYTLEVRTAAEYGVPEDYDPIRLELDEQTGFGRSFDTNDRLNSEAVTLIAPSGVDLLDGDIFVIGNGTRQVTFEFDSNGSVTSGRVRVPFNAAFNPIVVGSTYSPLANDTNVVASAIRDAINSPQAFGVLGIYAAGRDGREVGPMSDNRIELFGSSIQVNPSQGRFIKLDLVAEETFYGRETARTIPLINHATQEIIDVVSPDTFARAATTDYVNGNTDTLVAVGKVGDSVLIRDGGGIVRYDNGIDPFTDISVSQVVNNSGNVLMPINPQADLDIVKIFLRAGDVIDVDLDTIGWALGAQLDTKDRIGIPLNVSSLDGQTLTTMGANGQITTVRLTLGAPTGPNDVQFFANDPQIVVAFRIANVLDTLDASLNATFSSTELVLSTGEIVSAGPAFTKTSGSLLQIFNNAGTLQTDSTGFSASATGERERGAWIDNFVAPTSDYYYVVVGTNQLSTFFTGGGTGEYQLTVRPGNAVGRDVLMVDYHMDKGDTNVFRDQGQFIIESNIIRDFSTTGIRASFNTGQPDDDVLFSSIPLDRRPGAAATLRNPNTDRLIPGTVITNNVVVASGATGILFSGEVAASGNSPAPVPFGRIVNNTVVGSGSGIGINVTANASPTVLNNVVTGFATGVNIGAGSDSTIEGGNAYQNNTNNASRAIAASSIVIPTGTPLFQDPAAGIYIPAAGSLIIDSSFASLTDRSTFINTVKEPVGIAPSPIIAPSFDAFGIPRFDDPNVTTPSGIGSNVFIDRGAVDRSDLVRPEASLVGPLDFVAGSGVTIVGGDADPSKSFVRLVSGSVRFFEVQLFDPSGSGPDERTITDSSIILTENGIRLTPGVDYTFGYSDNSRLIRLTPLAGLWRTDAVYDITLNNERRVSLTLPAGDEIQDGDQYIITDSSGTIGRTSVFEFDSGYVLQVPQTLGFEVLAANTGFVDGQFFTITLLDDLGVPVATNTFEINRAGSVASGRIPINIGSPMDGGAGPGLSIGSTITGVRDAILAALRNPLAAALNLAPVAIGDESLQIGSLSGHTITGNITGLSQFGVASGVVPGDQFRYTAAGGASVLFEFTNGTAPPTSSAATPIPLLRTDTIENTAANVATAIRASALGLNEARSIGDGRALLGGRPADSLALLGTTQLQLVGTAGVSGKLTLTVPDTATPADLEGTTFIVQNGSEIETFVFTTNPLLVTPNRVILLSAADTPAEIADAIRSEIDAGIVSLTPTVLGTVISLNEQDATLPVGANQVRASLDVSDTILVADGVSGGAIPVSFIPTDGFSPASAATSLVNAIANSPLVLKSFSPGGGTLLFTDVRLILLDSNGAAVENVGLVVPAVTDLAGNAVNTNRDDNETRFTIIMPEVRFDFGDAPNSYGTLLAQNGARHTLTGNSNLRLGQFVDGEENGVVPPMADDDQVPIVLIPSSTALFRDNSDPTDVKLTVNAVPTSGDTLSVSIGGTTRVFQLILATDNAAPANTPVIFSNTEPLADIAGRLATAINTAFDNLAGSVLVAMDSTTAATLSIRAIDDEDGLSVGMFTPSSGGLPIRVFTRFNSTAPISEADVVGFVNPLDPAGTNLQVAVVGTGLIDMWVDYNQDGDFNDPSERVLSNAAVTDGINTLTIFAPTFAADGDTWMRVRLSEGGNLGPNGVAIGGEVEDYQITVRRVAPPTPVRDEYTINEDQTLVTSPGTLPGLVDNDLDLTSQLITPRVFVGTQPANGTLTIDNPLTGDFTYVPNPNFNGIDTFTYRLGTNATATAESLAVSTFATVTINVTAVNDAPQFTVRSTNNILEDQGLQVTIPGVITNATPGPATATDETTSQTVVLTIDAAGSTIPTGLMTQPATISPTGDLTVFPAPNAFGQAIYAIVVSDDVVPPQSVTTLVTVNVRPVNDAPIVTPSQLGRTDNAGPDLAYEIADGSNPDRPAGTLVFTLKEDGGPFRIPLRQTNAGLSFSQIGLLDPFVAGPANELAAHEGGPQAIRLATVGGLAPTSSGIITGANGTLTPVIVGGTLIAYDYTPPVDFNSSIAAFDTFTYTIVDQNGADPTSPEGYLNADGLPVNNPLTRTNQVLLVLNPINDTPQFTLNTRTLTVQEDAARLTQENFAVNIFAGPPQSAFDEVDVFAGQQLNFTVTSITFPQAQASLFFSEYPSVSPDGTLQFRPAADVFGSFEFDVVLNDDGPDNSTRGDDVSSDPVRITINVLPVNDTPARVPGGNELSFSLFEDTFRDIPLTGTNTAPGLLDIFTVGPANEAANTAPRPGGNQTLALDQPIPRGTTNGGTLTPVLSQTGQVVALRYTPRANFVGLDTFIYGVVDNGTTTDLDGVTRPDPRRGFATVSFTVDPVNDAPVFSGGANVVSDEDPTPNPQVTVTNWATNVQAGPNGADDEINGTLVTPAQTLSFVFVQTGGPTDLFASGPTATINGSNASLSYTAAANRNGVATFTVRLVDGGPTGTDGNVNASPIQTFTIRVNPVNDAPSFVPGAAVTVLEDSAAYRETWATSISPGPADEQAVPQTVSFEVTVPLESRALFQSQPTIDATGVLQFIPAANANGTATVTVRAIDSAGGISAPVTLAITITEVNDAPVAVPDPIRTDEDRVLTINQSQLLANDVDPDLVTNPNERVSVVMPAEQVSVSGARVSFNSTTGVITYDPTGSDTIQALRPGQTLIDSFSYRVRDAAGLESSPVTVALTVDGINDAPRVVADEPSFNSNGPTTIFPLANDTDIDGTINRGRLIITLQPAFGSLAVNPNDGSIVYSPFSTFTGNDEFRYTVADDLGQQSAESTVLIRANAAPTAGPDTGSSFRGEEVVINVIANDSDSNGTVNPASIQIVQAPQSGQAIPQPNGTVRYVPNPNFVGLDSFTYTIADNEGRRSTPATVRLQVVASRLQNPAIERTADVNDDGNISAVDALLVINRLNIEGTDVTRIPVLDTDRGAPFYDVNGDGFISTADALEVLRILNERDALGQTTPSSEGEFAVQLLTSSQANAPTGNTAATNPAVGSLWESDDDDASIADDVINRIAAARSVVIPESGDEGDGSAHGAAVDEVLRLLLS